jgi:hypothetical protein
MAWKVTGFMHGYDAYGKMPAVYGPLPRKVWINTAGPRYRRSYRGQRLVSTASTGTKKEVTTEKAKEYATWLATRDGLAIPTDCTAVCVWEDVVLTTGKLEARVSSVIWCRQDRTKGGWKTTTLLTIDIPNWNWQADEPVYSEDELERWAA